jgi:F0F1-type ATP synthase assembly protein I
MSGMRRPEDEKIDRPPLYQTAMLALLIPMLMLAGPVVGFLTGRYLDGRLGWAPWGQIAGLALGLGAGFRESYLIVRRLYRLVK